MLKDVKITRVYSGAAAGFGDTLSGDILDMTGFDGVMYIASFGDNAANATIALSVQQDTDAAGGTMATLSGETVTYTCTAADADNDLLVIDVYKPAKRYVRPQIVRGVANSVVNCIVAIQYNAAKAPVTQGSTVLDSALLVSPAEV